jgi:hypothetical protein
MLGPQIHISWLCCVFLHKTCVIQYPVSTTFKMLAHLKAKQREQNQDDDIPASAVQEPNEIISPAPAEAIGNNASIDAEKNDARLTCAALCSLSAMCCPPHDKGVTSGPSSEEGGGCMLRHCGLEGGGVFERYCHCGGHTIICGWSGWNSWLFV